MRAGSALFRPVRAGNALEETAERELAERRGVSRVTLREAIRALAGAR